MERTNGEKEQLIGKRLKEMKKTLDKIEKRLEELEKNLNLIDNLIEQGRAPE